MRDLNSPKYRRWRKAVFARDGYKCVLCGSKGKLNAHHIVRWADCPALRFATSNGCCLCVDCHDNKVTGNEAYWEGILRAKIQPKASIDFSFLSVGLRKGPLSPTPPGPSEDCEGMVVGTLPTGDYSLPGLENEFAIERKGSSGEFAQNIVQERFKDELLRLDSFRFPFLVLEFSMDDIMRFPENSGVPKSKWHELRIKPNFILSCLLSIETKYKTKVVLAGKYGMNTAQYLFKKMADHYGK